MIFSRIVQCSICDREEVTCKAYLPDGWVTLWDYPATLCDNCLAKWEKRYDERPTIWLEGGVKNPEPFI